MEYGPRPSTECWATEITYAAGMAVVLIAAMSLNRVIGRAGDLPWHQPDDLAHFKRLTLHHPVIMGRKTFDSFEGTLPGRLNIVVSRNPEYRAQGADVVNALERALALAFKKQPDHDVFVAGGGEIYSQAMPHADRIELTVMHSAVDGDASFPSLLAGDFVCRDVRYRPADLQNPQPMTYMRLERHR